MGNSISKIQEREGSETKRFPNFGNGTQRLSFPGIPAHPWEICIHLCQFPPSPPFDPTKGTPVVRGLRTCVTWLSTHWALSAPSPRLSPPLRCTAFHCLQVRGRSPNRPSVEKKSQEIKLLQGSRGEKNHNMLKVAKSQFATETEKYSESLLVMLRLGKTVPTNIAVTSEKCSKSL